MYISVSNFTKIINKKTILNNININFEKGKTYGLIGINGCGKTMLLKAICGLISATSGNVSINNKVVGNGVYAENVGIIIENIGLWNHLSAFENLKLLSSINKKINNATIIEWISKFGLDPKSNEKYKNFSLGMKQKLCLAQAFMEDPELLILDEPTNALDKKTIQTFYDCIYQEKTKGKTIIIASHIEADILNLCDFIIKMENGKVESINNCEDLLQ